MNWDGWVCMLTAVSFVTILFGWCCWKIVTDKEPDTVQDDSDEIPEDIVKEYSE